MKSKLALCIYILFAVLSFFFGVKMFQSRDTLRGILFMVAVICWGMCIYNNFAINKRSNQRLNVSVSQKNSHNKKK